MIGAVGELPGGRGRSQHLALMLRGGAWRERGTPAQGCLKKKKKITNLWLPNYKTPSNHCSIYTLVNMPPDNKEQSQLLLQKEARQKQKPPKKKYYRGKKQKNTTLCRNSSIPVTGSWAQERTHAFQLLIFLKKPVQTGSCLKDILGLGFYFIFFN